MKKQKILTIITMAVFILLSIFVAVTGIRLYQNGSHNLGLAMLIALSLSFKILLVSLYKQEDR